VLQGVLGDEMPPTSPHSVSVPGAAAGWCDAAERFGTMPLAALLAPAIQLAEEGFPVHEVAAAGWAGGAFLLTAENNVHGKDLLLPSGRPPRAGDIMKMPKLANTFRLLAEKGRDGFYKGEVRVGVVNSWKKRPVVYIHARTPERAIVGGGCLQCWNASLCMADDPHVYTCNNCDIQRSDGLLLHIFYFFIRTTYVSLTIVRRRRPPVSSSFLFGQHRVRWLWR
jgi:hypothetical protein